MRLINNNVANGRRALGRSRTRAQRDLIGFPAITLYRYIIDWS